MTSPCGRAVRADLGGSGNGWSLHPDFGIARLWARPRHEWTDGLRLRRAGSTKCLTTNSLRWRGGPAGSGPD